MRAATRAIQLSVYSDEQPTDRPVTWDVFLGSEPMTWGVVASGPKEAVEIAIGELTRRAKA